MDIFKDKDMIRALEYGSLLERCEITKRSLHTNKITTGMFTFMFFIEMIISNSNRLSVFLMCMFAMGFWFISKVNHIKLEQITHEKEFMMSQFIVENKLSNEFINLYKNKNN